MKTIAAEVVDRGEKQDARGRRIARAEERAALVEAYEKSGLTQRAFAEREGVKYCTFTAWLGRHRRSPQAKPEGAFAQVDLGLGGRLGGAIEVVMPDGVLVRGHDGGQIAILVAKLRGC